MNFAQKLMLSLIVLCCTVSMQAQTACEEVGNSVVLDASLGDNCAGDITFDVNGAGVNCSDCDGTEVFSQYGTATVTIFSNEEECGEYEVSVYQLPSITLTSDGAPNCNSYDFSASNVPGVSTWSWDFEGSGAPESSAQNGSYTFLSNGSQTVTLSIEYANGCEAEVTQNITVNGPQAQLSFTGQIEGDVEDLDVGPFGDFDCAVSYCVDDVAEDNIVWFSNVALPVVGGSATNYTVLFNGSSIYNAATAPANEAINMTALGEVGYNGLVYQITDSNGCVFEKEYTIYWANDVVLQATVDIGNPTTCAYDPGDVIDLIIDPAESNPNDVTYRVEVLCGGAVIFEYEETSDQADIVVPWTIPFTSCGCNASGRFEAIVYVSNACQVEIEDGSKFITVAADVENGFDADEIYCVGENEVFSWLGADQVDNPDHCDPDFLWTVSYEGNAVTLPEDDEQTLPFTFDQEGEYEVCLNISLNNYCNDVIGNECHTICVQRNIDESDTPVSWPAGTTWCVGDIYSPGILLPNLPCDPATVSWSVTSNAGTNAGVQITGSSTTNPIITFEEKGDYVVRAQVFSECGNPLVLSQTLVVGGEPIISATDNVLSSCPDQILPLDPAFCIDDCNSTLTAVNMTIYEGAIANCSANPSNDVVFSLPNVVNNLSAANFEPNCNPENASVIEWTVPSDAGSTYTLVVEAVNGCGSDVQCFPITIFSDNGPGISIPATVCQGSTIDPNEVGGADCEWYLDGVLVWNNPAGTPFTINQASEILVVCDNGNCVVEQEIDIDVFPYLDPSLSSQAFICEDATVTITTTTAGNNPTYQWYLGNCLDIPSGTLQQLGTASAQDVTEPGVYSVIMEENGCEACGQITINPDPQPIFACEAQSYCETSTEEIDLSCLNVPANAVSTTWNVLDDQGNALLMSISQPFTVADLVAEVGDITSNQTFTFEYAVLSNTLCDYTGSFEVIIQALGSAAVTQVETCFGNPINLSGGSAVGTWEFGNLPVGYATISGEDLMLNADLPVGDYTGILYDGGCNQEPFEVTIYDLPTVEISAFFPALCDETAQDGQTNTLTATGAGSGDLNYAWFNGGCDAFEPTPGDFFADNQFNVSDPNTWSVVVEDENGCRACDELFLPFEPNPNLNCPDQIHCETSDSPIFLPCLDVEEWESIQVTHPTVSMPFPGSDEYNVQQLIDHFGSEITQNETFTVVYGLATPGSCFYMDSYTVTIEDQAIANVSVVDTCFATAFELPGAITGTWDTGELPAGFFETVNGPLEIAADLPVGTYTAIAYDSGCALQPYQINITALPTAEIAPGSVLCDLPNTGLVINAASTGEEPLAYQWSEGGVDLDGATTTQLIAGEVGDYSFTVTDANGCTAEDDISVTLDPSPVSDCFPASICENLGDQTLDFACVTVPDGGSASTWTIEHPTNPNFPFQVPAGGMTVDELLAVFDPVEIAVQQDETFTFIHTWNSAANCQYVDSYEVTILDEQVNSENQDLCSGDGLNLMQANLGDWVWTNLPPTGASSLGSNNFSWTPDLSDAGGTYVLRFTSDLGCGATDYNVQIHATPVVSISTPDEDQCILTSQTITVEQGIATDYTIDYNYAEGVLPIGDLTFDPTAIGLSNTEPGELELNAWIEYITQNGGMLTCASQDFQTIDIVDTIASLSVPDFLCEGEAFDIDVCSDIAVDAFNFTIGGVSYTEDECPFVLPELFGNQAYSLLAEYGGNVGLVCLVEDEEEIVIQQALDFIWSTTPDSCLAQQALSVEVTGGNTTTITWLPTEVLSNDPIFVGESFNSILQFEPDDLGHDQFFSFQLQISDGVCTDSLLEGSLQYVAVPNLGISVDELLSDFDGCGNDELTMQVSIPNTTHIDSMVWSMDADYFDEVLLASGAGVLLPDVIELLPPPLEASTVFITAIAYGPCGSDTTTIEHIMEPSDTQLNTEAFAPQLCPGEEIPLEYDVNLIDFVMTLEVTPAADITWNPASESISIGQNVPEGNYTLEFTAIGGCGEDVSIEEVNILPAASANFTIDGFTCEGSDLSFSVIDPDALSSFVWDFGDGTISNLVNPTHNYPDFGSYTVTLNALDASGNCALQSIQEVEIGGGGVNIIPGNDGRCGGWSEAYALDDITVQSVEWTVDNPYSADDINYVTESTPELNFVLEEGLVSQADYWIYAEAIDALGCPVQDSVVASVYPFPNAEIGVGVSASSGDVSYEYSNGWLSVFLGITCNEAEIDFFNQNAANTCWWNAEFDGEMSIDGENCPTLTLEANEELRGQLVLLSDNAYGCISNASVNIDIICAEEVTLYVPNAFSPNDDGHNDVWLYSLEGVYEGVEVEIFDRWGNPIFYSDTPNEPWDGSIQRADHYAQNGVYNYQVVVHVTGTEKIEKKGWVTIFR